MKKNVFSVGILAVTFLAFTSCKDDKQAKSEETINNYVTYVDSVGNVSEDDAKANWDAIDAGYQTRVTVVDNSTTDNEELKQKLAESKAKYEALRAKYHADMQPEKEVVATTNPNQLVRDRFFGEGKVGEDMNFAWVNKDNILKVYQDFYDSYKANKEDFSREDYDEVKLLYEALDSRKNTVEKEGLSSEDNNKIASIKFKFSPMFKMNRIGAKARENKEAKE
ncbi:hypothetical protein [Flavobacterium sp.]|uniref:hypothetical protein n=1 Tax=Flavobacterium sp. TaxID=239 RepID=UPI0025D391E3|nr:hypothetical protein [Flavobacterium sp.]